MIHTRRIHIGELTAQETDHLVDFLWQLADALIALRPDSDEEQWPSQEETLQMLDTLAEKRNARTESGQCPQDETRQNIGSHDTMLSDTESLF